jgi:hypothetical protein
MIRGLLWDSSTFCRILRPVFNEISELMLHTMSHSPPNRASDNCIRACAPSVAETLPSSFDTL